MIRMGRIWARRAALMLFGAGLALVALEAGLQIGALALRVTGSAPPATWVGVRRRVLCVGDSNTYGLYLRDRGDAYPAQLERRWNDTPGLPPIEVLNLGYPGTNSSRLIRDLPHMLDTLRPDVVLLMVGSNDFWTAPVPPPAAAGVAARLMLAIREHSRVYQLLHMLGRAFDHRRLEVDYPVGVNGGASGTARFGDVEIPLGFTAGPMRGPDVYRELDRNLAALAAIVRERGAEPVFVTYGSGMWNYGDANASLRRVAAAAGVDLVEAAAAVAAVCPSEPCPRYLYQDHHPTADGYAVIADAVVRQLGRGAAEPAPAR